MKKDNLRIVFMGTPDFAVESLKALVDNGYNVVGVITMPDKPSGRGYKIQPSPVKKYAIEKALTVLQPEKLKNEEFLSELKSLKADLQIVVAFRMLPEVVWNMPRFGTFNLHASLLPQYRGAAPINWAIINGEKETGVTTFLLTHEIDTGKIIYQESVPIDKNDDAEVIHDRLMTVGSKLVLNTVDAFLNNTIESTPQNEYFTNENELKLAPKIFRDTCRINWNMPSEKVYNFIRGLSPYPTAWTELHIPDAEPVQIKIYKVEITESETINKAGTVITDNKKLLQVTTEDGSINILELQPPGKRRMSVVEFLNGNHIPLKSFMR